MSNTPKSRRSENLIQASQARAVSDLAREHLDQSAELTETQFNEMQALQHHIGWPQATVGGVTLAHVVAPPTLEDARPGGRIRLRDALPPLPCTDYNAYSDGSEPLYTAEQMREYAGAALAARQPVAQEPVAWLHDEDPSRVISASQKATALRDQGASGSSVRPYSVPAYLQTPTAQHLTLPYSLDADPVGVRARVADVITGTLMVAAQGHTPPPAGHWAQPFWEAARHDAAISLNVTLRLRELVVASKYMRDRVVETRGVKCMDDLDWAINEAEKALTENQVVGHG